MTPEEDEIIANDFLHKELVEKYDKHRITAAAIKKRKPLLHEKAFRVLDTGKLLQMRKQDQEFSIHCSLSAFIWSKHVDCRLSKRAKTEGILADARHLHRETNPC